MTLKQRLWFWGLATAAFFGLIWLLKGMLLPFVIGLAVAYFLDPLTDRVEKMGLNRALSTSVVLGVFVLVFAALIALAFPVLQTQFIAFAETLPGYVTQAHDKLLPWLEKLQAILRDTPEEDLKAQASQYASTAMNWAGNLLKGVWDGGIALFDILSVLLVAPVVSFYMLRDWDKMIARIDSWLPRPRAKVIRQLCAEMDTALAGFVRGQAMVCVVLGAIYGVALTIAGLNFGLFIGFMAGILSFMPYVGSIVGFGVAMIVAYFQFGGDITQLTIIAAIFGLGQFFEGNFLTPRLVGEKVGLHALWVLFALMAGGSLMGFVGVMIGVPVAAVTGVLVRYFLRQYLVSPYYTGRARRQIKTSAKDA